MFSLEKKKFRLVVDGIRAQDGQLTNAELSSMKQQFLSPVYLGSTPHSLHKELKVLNNNNANFTQLIQFSVYLFYKFVMLSLSVEGPSEAQCVWLRTQF